MCWHAETLPDRVTSRLVLEPGREADAAPGTEALVRETRDSALGALRRQGTVEEQAAVIAFLASEDARFGLPAVRSCDKTVADDWPIRAPAVARSGCTA